MAGVSDYFSIGSTVACKTCYDKEIEGEVLAFDQQTKMLILSILFKSRVPPRLTPPTCSGTRCCCYYYCCCCKQRAPKDTGTWGLPPAFNNVSYVKISLFTIRSFTLILSISSSYQVYVPRCVTASALLSRLLLLLFSLFRELKTLTYYRPFHSKILLFFTPHCF